MSSLMPVKFLDLNEGDDPKSLPPGTMLLNRNCRMDKGRRLAKRMGVDTLGTSVVGGGNVAAGRRLVTRGTDTAIFDGEKLYARVGSLAAWQPLDRPPSLNVAKRELIDSVRSVLALDVATYGDWLIMVYATGMDWLGSLFCEIRDLTTRDVVLPATLITSTSAWSPRIAIQGTTAYFVYGTSGNISFQALSLTTLTLGASGNIVTDALVGAPKPDNGSSEGSVDIAYGTPSGGVPTLWVAYQNNGVAVTANRFTVIRCDLDGVFGNLATKRYLGNHLTSVAIEFCAAAQKVVAVYADCDAAGTVNYVRAITINPDAATGSVGQDTIVSWTSGGSVTRASRVTLAEVDATNVIIGWDVDRRTSDVAHVSTGLYSIAAHALVANSSRYTPNVRSFCKPFSLGGRWYFTMLALLRDSGLTVKPVTPSRVIVEIETANSLTGVNNGLHVHAATIGDQTSWYGPMVTRTVVDSAGTRYVLSPHRNSEPINAAQPIAYGWDLYRVEPNTVGRTALMNAGALCSGGAPFWYDGVTAMPYGFDMAPSIDGVTDTTTAGASMVPGLYSYVVVYEWLDANGVLQRSIPSDPATGTVVNNSLTLVLRTASLSAKVRTRLGTTGVANPVILAIYRTTVGGTGSHYRLTQAPVTGVVINDSQAGTIGFVDISSDANIGTGVTATMALASQEQLYTDLGELADVPPPDFITCIVHAGRFAGVGDESTVVWLSKDGRLDQTIAPGFNEALQLTFAHRVTALASLDEKLVVFGLDTISVVHGDGPDDKGLQNTWQVQALQTDVGCIEPRSTVVSPLGVMFQSRRGIELLDRGLSVTWVGTAVTDSLSTYPIVTSAVLVASESEIRFTCTSADGTQGIVLVWDYMYKTWFTRAYRNVNGVAFTPFVDAALIGGVYTALGADGAVYQETDAHALDAGGVFVVRDVQLAPISPGGSGLGWNRVKDVTLLGTTPADMNHQLEVSVAHDYATTWEQVETFAASAGPTNFSPDSVGRVQFARQKCQAVQLRIRDLAPGGIISYAGGRGPLFEGLALRVDVKQGPVRISDGGQK